MISLHSSAADRHIPSSASDQPESAVRSSVEPVAARPGRIGDVLVCLGCLTAADRDRVLDRQRKTGGRFGEVATRMRLVGRKDIQKALSVQYGLHIDGVNRLHIPRLLTTITEPTGKAAEDYRLAATRLMTQTESSAARLLAVSGLTPKCGTAQVAANLAIAFRQLQRRVLIIDCDLERAGLHRQFSLKERPGLAGIASGQLAFDDAVAPPMIRGLTILPARPGGQDISWLASSAFKKLVMEQLDRFDTVVLATGPHAGRADTRHVWALAKSVLLVARRDKSRTGEAKDAIHAIRECDAELVGSILTS